MKYLFCLLIAILFCQSLTGQGEKDLLKEMMAEDRSAAEAVVLYPEEIRNSIFVSAQQPQILLRLSKMQKNSANSFLALIGEFPQSIQAKFYEVTRYPGLLDSIIIHRNSIESDLLLSLNIYPDSTAEMALSLARLHFDYISKIHKLKQDMDNIFQEMIKDQPSEIQQAFEKLIELPEVLSILTDNIELTILVGDIFSRDPHWVREKAEELSLEIARRQAQELEDYKSQLENDPDALREMQEAAELYAQDNQIAEESYKNQTDMHTTTKVVYAYPYWFGYPHWYTYPYWTPVPYYYHTGFYINTDGAIIIIGLPSYHYVHWHYSYYPHRHIHLHAHYYRHYQTHRNARGEFYKAMEIDDRNFPGRSAEEFSNLPKRQTLTDREKPDLRLGQNEWQQKKFQNFKNNDNLQGNWRTSTGSIRRKG